MESKKKLAIIECAELGQINSVISLIQDGKDVNEANSDGDCAVLVAARRNDLELFRILIEADANLDVKDAAGCSVLDWARLNNNTEMIKLIESRLPSLGHFMRQ